MMLGIKQPGDILTALDWNELVRIASDKPFTPTNREVWVRNESGAAVPHCGVLGIDGPYTTYSPSVSVGLFTDPKNLVLSGVEPTVSDHADCKWCVIQEPAVDGQFVRALASGVAQVRVYVNSTTDGYCDVSTIHADGSSTCYLSTGSSGAQILWLDPNTAVGSVGWAIVRLGGNSARVIRFRLDADLTVCGTAQATILHELQDGSSSSDTDAADCTCSPFTEGDTVTISDRCAIVGASLLAEVNSSGEQYIPAGTMGYAVRLDDAAANTYEPVAFGEATCSDSSSSSSDSDSQNCLPVAESVLANVPYAGDGEVAKYVLGQDANGCVKWFALDECDVSDSA